MADRGSVVLSPEPAFASAQMAQFIIKNVMFERPKPSRQVARP